MKYLKSFFEAIDMKDLPEDIKQNLKDICLELTDNGFEIYLTHLEIKGNIKSVYGFEGYCVVLRISKKNSLGYYENINTEEVREIIGRVKDYMKTEGYMSDVLLCNSVLNNSWVGHSVLNNSWVADSNYGIKAFYAASVIFQK